VTDDRWPGVIFAPYSGRGVIGECDSCGRKIEESPDNAHDWLGAVFVAGVNPLTGVVILVCDECALGSGLLSHSPTLLPWRRG
jgi:hypothetical protein